MGKYIDTFRAAVKAELAQTSAGDTDRAAETKQYYRAQVGAFSKKENAEAML